VRWASQPRSLFNVMHSNPSSIKYDLPHGMIDHSYVPIHALCRCPYPGLHIHALHYYRIDFYCRFITHYNTIELSVSYRSVA
jgi:hypothetical protein